MGPISLMVVYVDPPGFGIESGQSLGDQKDVNNERLLIGSLLFGEAARARNLTLSSLKPAGYDLIKG